MQSSSSWHWRVTRGALLGLFIGLALLVGAGLPPLRVVADTYKYFTLDLWFVLRAERPIERVAVLAIDEATMQRWKGNAFNAAEMARLLEGLRDYEVPVVAFSLPAMTDADLLPQGNEALLTALGRSAPVVMPLDFRSPEELPMGSPAGRLSPEARRSLQYTTRFSLDLKQVKGSQYGTAVLPGSRLLAAPSVEVLRRANGVGHLSLAFDRVGRARLLPTYLQYRGRLYPALTVSAARTAGVQVMPTGSEGILLNYPYGANGERAPFPVISVAAALQNPRWLENVRHRAVIIGTTAPGVATRYPAPTGQRVTMAELQAVALDNLLTNRPLREGPEVWYWLLTLVPAMITGGFAAARRPAWSGMIALLCFVALALTSLGLFWQDIWMDVSVPWLAVGLTVLVGIIGRSRGQEREATHVASTIEALTKVSDIIAAQTKQWDLLDRVLHWSTGVLGATGASALLLDEEKQELFFAAALGPNSDRLLGLRLSLGEGIAGYVAHTGEPVVVNDARRDERFQPRVDASTGFSTLSILCVPLKLRDKTIGVIEVVNKQNGLAFTPGDVELLQAVANQSAVALENSRLYERLSQRVEQSQGALALAYRQLQSEKSLLQTVLHSMTDGVVVTDSAGFIQLVNPAAEALMPELIRGLGQPLVRAIHDFPLAALPPLDGIQPTWQSEPVVLFRGDVDAPRHIEARCAPLQNAEGELAGIVAVFADVTQRLQVEKAKSDFVSFVAHEMRSPLTSISGFSAMLSRSDNGGTPISPVTRQRFLGLIHDESERLTRLINNLLDVARIEAGRAIELNREVVDIKQLVREAIESQRTYSSRHQMVAGFDAVPVSVYADADKVTQVLINLLSNALKYSPGGTVRVGVKESQNVTGQWVDISVQDEGPGIPPEQRKHLFERFQRVQASAQGTGRGAKPTGTGLGLFLTKYLIEAHGGGIWVESEPGQGATFHFTLPAVRDDELAGAQPVVHFPAQ